MNITLDFKEDISVLVIAKWLIKSVSISQFWLIVYIEKKLKYLKCIGILFGKDMLVTLQNFYFALTL